MALPYRVLEDATVEVEHAATVYELEGSGLARRFLKAYAEALEHASSFPRGGVAHDEFPSHEIRAFHLDVFPYTIFVVLRPEELVIVAVQHQGQEPGYWAHRLEDVDP